MNPAVCPITCGKIPRLSGIFQKEFTANRHHLLSLRIEGLFKIYRQAREDSK